MSERRQPVRVTESAGWDELYDEWFVCPACTKKDLARDFAFCPHCGVALDWTQAPPNTEGRTER